MTNIPIIERGAKIGLHVERPNQARLWLDEVKKRGARPAFVFSISHPGLGFDVRAVFGTAVPMITRFYTPWWDSAHGVETWSDAQIHQLAGAAVQYIFDHTNPDERAVNDYYAVLNEADPLGADLGPAADYAWFRFGVYLRYVAEEATRRGIKILTPGTNFGTPEWSQMQALIDSGVFQALQGGGHGWLLHEGVIPGSGDPLAFDNLPIPGAPAVPGAGSLVYRYRYLNHALQLRGLGPVLIVISEWRSNAGYDVGQIGQVVSEIAQYDRELRRDAYVLGFAGFTFDPTDGWVGENYNPVYLHPLFLDYMAGERNVANSTVLPQPVRRVTNQQVFNAVSAVSQAAGVNLIGLMPHDLVRAMVAARGAPYSGPAPTDWGLTPEQKAAIVAELKRRGLAG